MKDERGIKVTNKDLMKAVVIYEPGGPERLCLEARPIPSVKSGWSLVKVKGFGINHSEIFTRQGLSPSVRFPRILGIECVGTVEKTTTAALKEGQRVVSIMGEMGRAFDGSYAEYVLLPNEQIFPVETTLSWPDLAAVPETYYTAFGAYKTLKIGTGDSILVRGASSGVGTAFLKLLKAEFPGASVTGSVRSLSKKKDLLALGYDHVVEDRGNCLVTSGSFTKVLELVGPASVRDSLRHMPSGGILCVVGLLGGKWFLEDFNPIDELENNVYMTAFHSARVSREKMDELFRYIDARHINIHPDKIFSLDDIVRAHQYLENTGGYGKVVVVNP